MTTVRLRYEKGYFVPLDPLPDLQEGDEIEVEWPSSLQEDEIRAMLDRTRGLWADWEEIEQFVEDARQKWDQAWRDTLSL